MSTNEPNAQTPGDGGQTPWPQYGQVGDTSATPSPAAGSVPAGPAPVPGGPAPYAATQPLPGRGKSIAMIVIGLLMIPASIVIFIGGSIASAFGASGGIQVSVVDNGGTVTVPDNAVVSVSDGSGQATECALSGPADVPLPETTAGGNRAFQAQGVPAGDYTVTCDAGQQLGYTAIANADQIDPDAVRGGLGTTLIISSVVGLLGLVLLIVGIVLLVKTNKKRREIRGY
ncbi:MAG: hypothetical protein Q4C87_01285 [Actinomycetaceae bacterium]|nr:hypothetical protein [Actinomycetaceae bacterium]